MSIIAFKIENNKIRVGADGRITGGDYIVYENSDKIFQISDNLIIGATGLSEPCLIFKRFVEDNKETFENMSSSIDFIKQAKPLKDFFMEEYGYEESHINKEFGGFLVVNKQYHGVLYFAEEGGYPYIREDSENVGCIGSSSAYTQAFLDVGYPIEEAIKMSAKRYTTINDNVKMLEINL